MSWMAMAEPQGEERAGVVVDLDERAWLPRHAAGDGEAFAALVAAYRRPVYGFLARTGVAPASRDDLFQEIFMRVHGAAKSYDPSRPLRPWLFTIVVNTVRTHFRGVGLRQAMHTDAPDADPPDPAPSAHDQAVARETAAWLESAISKLPLAHREALVLSCIEGLEQQDVATALGIPVNTVKTHVRRARMTLAHGLAERRSGERS